MSPEEKQRRDEYRKTLTHEQRATMAIGVLMLNWAYWDGDITHHIFFLRDKAATEIDVSAQRVLSLHKDRLKTLRRLVVALTADKSEEVRRYDAIAGIVAPLTVLRGAIAHGLVGVGNPSGTHEDLRLILFSQRHDDSVGELSRTGSMEMPRVSEVFEAADTIWDERQKLQQLVSGLTG
ncbi:MULTISPECIES: hypothetical protein [unclassified Bradyrhizobium]|uniref:hypothetical protein n=1 Tax=unclassified Bradyrhizobium TaxID=2631580 RepID=UPI0028EA3D74|nr:MULTISPECIES: hypothetical protein [unclassified Bradyrhizobium]